VARQISLFIYLSTLIALKQLNSIDYNRHSRLTWWCSGNASASGAKGPVSISGSVKGFYV